MELHLSNIHFEYSDSVSSILQNTNATFTQGWTGIVGDNGCGKTTLARIATGQLSPDSGTVNPHLMSVYCDQDITKPPEHLDDFAYAYDGTARYLRKTLRLEDDWLFRYDTLSSGQRKRIQIAVCLWQQPDVLAIDEPTNYVDAATRVSIAEALAKFQGIGLLISHDRKLIDSLVGQCLFFESGQAVVRPGTYSEGREQQKRETIFRTRQREHAQQKVSKLKTETQRRSQVADQTAARRSGKNLAKHDSDGRERLRLAVISGQDGKAGQLASKMEARLSKAVETRDSLHIEKRYQGDIWMESEPHHRKTLLHLDETDLPLGAQHWIHFPELSVGNTDHIGLTGDNGFGKSTFINHALSQLASDMPYLFIPQEVNDTLAHEILNRMASADRMTRGKILAIVAQLNSDPKRILEGTIASPGELQKLMLAQGILEKPSLIVMDEPSNHLDIGSIEAMERVLSAFPGALIMVSHDKDLVAKTTDIKWIIRGKEGEDSYLSQER